MRILTLFSRSFSPLAHASNSDSDASGCYGGTEKVIRTLYKPSARHRQHVMHDAPIRPSAQATAGRDLHVTLTLTLALTLTLTLTLTST